MLHALLRQGEEEDDELESDEERSSSLITTTAALVDFDVTLVGLPVVVFLDEVGVGRCCVRDTALVLFLSLLDGCLVAAALDDKVFPVVKRGCEPPGGGVRQRLGEAGGVTSLGFNEEEEVLAALAEGA